VTRATSAFTVAVAVVFFCLFWSLLHHGFLGRDEIVDTPVYAGYADKVVDGAVPYRDFDLEYPPGALAPILAPALVVDHDEPAFDRWFDRLMALCGAMALVGTAVCLAALRAPPARWAGALGLFAVSPVLLGSVVLSRFDFWPAALAVWALAALLWRRPAAGAVLLGLAIATKLWPAALLPLGIVWVARTAGARAAARWTAGVVGVVAAVFLPFVVLSPGGVWHSLHAQLARPLQLESLGAAVLIAVHHAAGTSLHVASDFGSQNVTGTGAHAVEIATSVLGAVALIAVWILFARGPATAERLVTHAAASIAVLLAFGKVFSPQFMVWLIPFVVLVPGVRGAAAGVLLAAGLVLTQSWFPRHYWPLANDFSATQSGELLARDLVVLALAVVLAWPSSQHELLGKHRSRLEALQRVRAQVQ
jgi:uncharacterized membrane protein